MFRSSQIIKKKTYCLVLQYQLYLSIQHLFKLEFYNESPNILLYLKLKF